MKSERLKVRQAGFGTGLTYEYKNDLIGLKVYIDSVYQPETSIKLCNIFSLSPYLIIPIKSNSESVEIDLNGKLELNGKIQNQFVQFEKFRESILTDENNNLYFKLYFDKMQEQKDGEYIATLTKYSKAKVPDKAIINSTLKLKYLTLSERLKVIEAEEKYYKDIELSKEAEPTTTLDTYKINSLVLNKALLELIKPDIEEDLPAGKESYYFNPFDDEKAIKEEIIYTKETNNETTSLNLKSIALGSFFNEMSNNNRTFFDSNSRGDVVAEKTLFEKRKIDIKESLTKRMSSSLNDAFTIQNIITQPDASIALYNYSKSMVAILQNDYYSFQQNNITKSDSELKSISDINYKLILKKSEVEYAKEPTEKFINSNILTVDNRNLIERISDAERFPLNILYEKYKNEYYRQIATLDRNDSNYKLLNGLPLKQYEELKEKTYKNELKNSIRNIIIDSFIGLIDNFESVENNIIFINKENGYDKFILPKLNAHDFSDLELEEDATTSEKKVFTNEVVNNQLTNIIDLLTQSINDSTKERWEVYDAHLG